MSLDRDLQRQILEELAQKYPEPVDFYLHEHFEEKMFQANLFYLQEHGLINGKLRGEVLEDHGRRIGWATITKDGLDFLADDGGLSAIVHPGTVRFDAHNVRALFEDKIIASPLSEEEKERLLKKFKNVSGETLQSIVLKLIDKGLERPDLWQTLMRLVGL
jgi:hypothetical protein